MYKYVIIVIMFVLAMNGFVSNVYASSEFEVQSGNWSVLANKVLTFAQQKKYAQALGALKQLEDQLVKSNLAEKNLTVDSLHILLSTILDAKGNLSRIKPNDKKISEAVTKLVLAFDAVSHSKEPQWKGYYTSLLDKTNNIEAAVKKGNKKSVLQQVNGLNNEYQLLRPALIIAKSPSTVNHFDSLIAFMQKKATLQEVGSNLGELRELIKNIFQGTEKDVLAMFHPLKHLPIVIPTFWIIGFIVAILGIVSWRKHVSFTQM